MQLTPTGWDKFEGGLTEPIAVFDRLLSRHQVISFNSRDFDRKGHLAYDLGLTGNTLCEAAAALGATDFAIAARDAARQARRRRHRRQGGRRVQPLGSVYAADLYCPSYSVLVPRMKMKNVAVAVISIAGLVCLTLLVSGTRVLVWETKVNPGEVYVVEEHGDLGGSKQATLVCRYFTGRSIRTSVLWYSSNNIMGKDQCPFTAQEP
ncbi:hypothetical protein [Azoarcus sp. KH32C]|uniref:hypothetical protein n=1 Tax=Azoarcus sp. KH32C TaxID=748247 RepID=UPI00023860F7|nr:hypothetical protein [Azoarcus sp. KH32C]BAL23503.1 hypothetical protein AZKH_1174 [Azoarcus sp. KH32C]